MNLIDSIGHDVDSIRPKIYKKENFFLKTIKNIFLMLFFSSFVFVSINLPAYVMIGQYAINPESFIIREEPEIVMEKTAEVEVVYKPTVVYPDNSIIIPDIGVKAPIVWDVEGQDIMARLEDGVVHISGSSKVGQGGNIFLTGHSSNYWWKAGDYNTIFALLPKLEQNAAIYLTNNGILKKYQVTEMKEVKKSEVDQYLKADQERLTLMTCVPIGTNLRRLLIFADPV